MLNWWAIHYDEERYPDPHDFVPDRYMDHKLPAADYMAIGDPYQRDHFTYGAGRRSCPGVHVAEKSMVHLPEWSTHLSLWSSLVYFGDLTLPGPWTRTAKGSSRISCLWSTDSFQLPRSSRLHLPPEVRSTLESTVRNGQVLHLNINC
jgi:hypothetical protein